MFILSRFTLTTHTHTHTHIHTYINKNIYTNTQTHIKSDPKKNSWNNETDQKAKFYSRCSFHECSRHKRRKTKFASKTTLRENYYGVNCELQNLEVGIFLEFCMSNVAGDWLDRMTFPSPPFIYPFEHNAKVHITLSIHHSYRGRNSKERFEKKERKQAFDPEKKIKNQDLDHVIDKEKGAF